MLKIQLRNDRVHISGYVNAVDRFSRPIKDESGLFFIEKISPGAFQRALNRAGSVDVKLNHERTLTSTKDSSITLREDSIGLYFDGDITDPEVIENARARKLRGWSFGFVPIRKTEEESRRAGIAYERQVDELDITEVSIINERKMPCYEGTSIRVRAEENEVEYLEEEEQEVAPQSAEPTAHPEGGAEEEPESGAQEPENGAKEPEDGGEEERKCKQERALLELRKRRLDLMRG